MARVRSERLVLILKHLANSALLEDFQHWLYSEASENVTISQIDEKYMELCQSFHLCTPWEEIDHIFSGAFNTLDYAIAYLGAIQIWQNSLSNPKKALEQYRYALSLGASRSLPELFEAAGATFAFDRLTLRNSVQFVKEQLEQL